MEKPNYLGNKADALRLATDIYAWWAAKGVHAKVWIEDTQEERPDKSHPLWAVRSNVDPWTGKTS